MMSSKKGFWASIRSVKCPECDKWYQHRMFMIHHMMAVHGYSWDKAKETVITLEFTVQKCIVGRDKLVGKIVDLGFCPRCKSDWPMMTRVVKGVKFCHLCSFDVEEDRMELERWVKWAKEYAKNMM